MRLVIAPDGRIEAVYSELIDLAGLGRLHVTRASHVEPGTDGHWSADLAPVGGPVLGPFRRRSEALAAEQDWLEAHWPARPG